MGMKKTTEKVPSPLLPPPSTQTVAQSSAGLCIWPGVRMSWFISLYQVCAPLGGVRGWGGRWEPFGPVMLLQWHPLLPVKNQARWVVQFLADMTALHVHTGDSYFNIILVDFESEDMDVERALRAAQLPR